MVKTLTRINPFPGLRPFNLDEEHLFFGREGQADELLRRLERTRFLAIVGTSGSGKSSLVRAGLLPTLYSGLMAHTSSGWRIAILRPGNAPIQNLANALCESEALGQEAPEPTPSPSQEGDQSIQNPKSKIQNSNSLQSIFTETTLRRGAPGLIEVVRQARLEAHESVLVVVDQFEELFRFKQVRQSAEAEDEAIAFVKLLLTAVKQRQVPIYVVLTMRSDFLGDCAQFRDLPEALNDGQYLIPRMTRDQRRTAIEGPVAVGEGTIASRLVNRLLNDVGDNPDQLPILQHAMMRTWDNWVADHGPGESIDLRHYEAIGGMDRALSLHADEIYDGLPDDRSRDIAESLFKCLTEKATDGRGVRRPTRLGEICAIAEATPDEVMGVIDRFRGGGTAIFDATDGDAVD